ncbi:hypothetical protein GCM10022289_44650 [Pedobacter jeongneungensis]|uniref:HicB family RNase H-like nuclease n=1 Tax=Pedobacter jeongneungensis TaxID=947309 RepID=A0ABP8BQU9_9SPHI
MNDILSYKNYYASVHYSSVDEVFFGKMLAINDLVTFEGDSVKVLKIAFEEAVGDYLETCAEVGKVPDKTYRGSSMSGFQPIFINRQRFLLTCTILR